jgi:hypothetical protein
MWRGEMTYEVKPKEYVLIRSLRTDELIAISADSWADYKWDMKSRTLSFEEVISGEKGYLTMLEQLANDENETTEDYK